MKKIIKWIFINGLIFSYILLQGCTSAYKPLLIKDFSTITPLKVVFYGEPVEMRVESRGGHEGYLQTFKNQLGGG